MTPEQKQRIQQIEARQNLRNGRVMLAAEGVLHDDVDFLLSLVKSQEAGNGGDVRMLNQIRKHAADGYERASGGSEVKAANLMLNDLHYVLSSHDGQFARGCTSMRSACVEKVREAQRQHEQVTSESEDYEYSQAAAFALCLAADELESLSIEQPKE